MIEILRYLTHMRTHLPAAALFALGHAGDFAVTLRGDGFNWVIPQGPNAKIQYTATVTRHTWHEVGDRIVEGRPPMRFFEMTLKRVGDSDWPAGNPIPPR